MTRPRPIGLLRSTLVLLGKDLLIEWRTRARLNALIFFALSTLLLFSFALGPDTKLLERNAGGYLWLAILFASTLSLGESFRVEHENACLDGLRLAPADARAIFLSKAVGNTLLLVVLGGLLIPVMVALYGVKVMLGRGRAGDHAGARVHGACRPRDRVCGHRQQRPRAGRAAASAIVPADRSRPAGRGQGDDARASG